MARDATSNKGNSYETPKLACGYARGRARKLPQNLDENQEEPSPSVTAAATTLAYTMVYGGYWDNKDGEEELVRKDPMRLLI